MKQESSTSASGASSRFLTFASALEGISLLVLVLIAMPLKYIWDYPSFTRITGGIHGVLFLIVLFLWFQLAFDRRWGVSKSLKILLVSCLPFGFLWVDRKLQDQ